MKNFNEEDIPDIDIFVKRANELLPQLASIKEYRFRDLYKESRKGEYWRIFAKTDPLINSKSKRERKTNDEISGLYIFYKNNKACYIGISNTIIRRIKQHMCGKTHFESTLAYNIVTVNIKSKESKTREEIYRENEKLIREIQREMRDEWSIKIIPETGPYERHFFEVYLATRMQTHWNCFDTH